MKRKVLFITAILMAGTIVLFGQEKEKEAQRVGGIRAGWHTANFIKDGSKADTSNNLNSFYVGFFRDTKILSVLRFGSGLEYFQNGVKYTSNTQRVLHTISVPLDLKVKLGPVYALGGLAFNFKVSEKLKIGGEYISPLEADKSAWFDIPVFVGAGVKLAFVIIEARYHYGLFEVRNGMHSHYLQIGAGISF